MPIRFQVDPDFYDHPKAIGMSDAATALWVRAGSYSAAKTSDGFIADDALALLSQTPMEAARELCRRGLWQRVRGGYRFHQWESRNLTRARVEADKEADRLRKRRERANGKPQVEPPIVRPDSTPDSGRNPTGVRPLSVSVSVSESVSGRDGPQSRPFAALSTSAIPSRRRAVAAQTLAVHTNGGSGTTRHGSPLLLAAPVIAANSPTTARAA
jgi:hypothetical protein